MVVRSWKRLVPTGLLVAVLVLFVAAGIRFGWFADPSRGVWPWIEASSWIVGIGVGISSLMLAMLERRRATAAPAEPGRDPGLLDRDTEFDDLRTRLSARSSGVVTVVGVAGIGKSKLVEAAVKAVEEEAPRPFVCCHTVSPGIRFDIRLLIANIRGHRSLPARFDEGGSLLDSLTAALANAWEERVIIVIDAAQHLARSSGDRHLDLQLDEALQVIHTDRRHHVTVVLVSTELLKSSAGGRRWLEPSAAITLSWLPTREFNTLLDRAGLAALRKKRKTLREQLQGNPGCVALMRARNELSARERGPDELMARLGPTVTVHDLLTVTIGELSQPRRKVVHALVACGTPVDDATVIAVLSGYVPDVEVVGALKDLTKHRLVSMTADELYHLPVSDADALLPPEGEERTKLLRRAADELGRRRVAKPTSSDQLRLHLAQLRVLLAAERYGVAYDVIDEIAPLVHEWNCEFLLLEQREQVRDRLGEESREMLNENALGILYAERGDFLAADVAFGRALAYAHKVGETELRTAIRTNFAAMYWQMGDAGLAHGYYDLARSDAQEQGENDFLVKALLGLADCHRRWGQYDKAVERAEEVLSMTDGIDAASIVKASLRLCRWYTETGDLPEARARLTAARTAAAGEPRLGPLCLDAEADVLLAARRYDDARAKATVAVELALELQDPAAILQSRTTLCMTHLRKDDLDQAAPHIEDAMRYRRKGRALIVLALHALVMQATDPAHARRLFDDLAAQARERIEKDEQDFGAYDMLGFAICGVLLDTDVDLDGAIRAFDASRAITRGAEPGLQERRLFLVHKLDGWAGTTDRLAPVIQALSGASTRPPE